MNIIISPAKKMNCEWNGEAPDRLPVFIEDAKRLKETLSHLTKEELKTLLCANDSITELNYLRYQEMNLEENLIPAVAAYTGLQYQAMAPVVFSDSQWNYVKQHLKILSGFYGLLGACDGVTPYRLEMQARLCTQQHKDLYGYWGDRIYKELVREDKVILNLASKEYSRAVEPYLESDNTWVTCVFGEWSQGKIKVKATKAKMARGSMVRWLAENQIQEIRQIQQFHQMGYSYAKEFSSDTEYVFIQSNSRAEC